MEKITLRSDQNVAVIQTAGAELCSFRKDGREYIWQATPEVWARHAPVLFPIVGKLRDNQYQHGGKTYTLGQHGFARDRKFDVLAVGEDYASFQLRSDDKSLAVYPFDFFLSIDYRLQGSELKVDSRIENPSQVPMYYSIGAHPGFICPLLEGESLNDYIIDFHDQGLPCIERYPLEGAYLSTDKVQMTLSGGKLRLHPDLLAEDALIFDVLPQAIVSVRNPHTGHGFGMEYTGFRWLGIWAKNTEAGFLCLEPWNGIADSLDASGELSEKLGIRKLAPGETETFGYTLKFY